MKCSHCKAMMTKKEVEGFNPSMNRQSDDRSNYCWEGEYDDAFVSPLCDKCYWPDDDGFVEKKEEEEKPDSIWEDREDDFYPEEEEEEFALPQKEAPLEPCNCRHKGETSANKHTDDCLVNYEGVVY